MGLWDGSVISWTICKKNCTLLQTDIHITQLVNFYRPYALPVHLYCSA